MTSRGSRFRRLGGITDAWVIAGAYVAAVVGIVSFAKAVSDGASSAFVGWLEFVALSGVLVFAMVAVPLRTRLVRQHVGMLTKTQQAREQAATDPLTGLANRRASENFVKSMLRSGVPFSVAICDLDEFKRLNDTYGHDAGDVALRVFSRTMTTVVRRGDVVARHGGEEFLVILPVATKENAAKVLDRARLELMAALSNGACPPFTFSAGVADTKEATDWPSLLRLADQRLLAAKRAGRDRVLTASA